MKKEQKNNHPDAFGLFPDLMKELVGSRARKEPAKSSVHPPPLPDLSWIGTGVFQEEEQVKDIPSALVLMVDEGGKNGVSSELQGIGYQIETADSPMEALAKLHANRYTTIIMHARFGEEPFADSTVYNYIKWLPVARRRAMFFILAGPDFRTLYNLEALSLSVNLVVNDADIERLKPILKKSFRDHEELFGPLIEAVRGYEKM